MIASGVRLAYFGGMSNWPAIWRILLLSCLGFVWSGCFPNSQKPYEEDKDPYFIEGKNRFRSYDYSGAAESYVRVLNNNPNSALAHFELGMIYKDKAYDPIAAIYHLDRYLRLRPKSDLGEVVKMHMEAMKIDIAKSVSYGVVARDVQRQMDQLITNNLALRIEMTNNRATIATNRFESTALKTELAALKELFARRPLGVTNTVTNYIRSAVPAPQNRTVLPPSAPSNQNRTAPRPPAPSPQATIATRPSAPSSSEAPRRAAPIVVNRTHLVKAGQTYDSIAVQYGVSTVAVKAANPRIDAGQLSAGQLINVPVSRR